MTSKDIKKAWESCISEDCESCPLQITYPSCDEVLYRETKEYIDRLEAENERLREPTSASAIEKLAQMAVNSVDITPKFINKIKAEAYKEFAEKLCEDWQEGEDEVRCVINIPRWIMHTYEEMVGDD